MLFPRLSAMSMLIPVTVCTVDHRPRSADRDRPSATAIGVCPDCQQLSGTNSIASGSPHAAQRSQRRAASID